MNTTAVVVTAPEHLSLSRVDLTPPGHGDVVVDIEWSGISTGTERLLYTGRMPHFPGMGYPLVPGYESVGRVTAAGPQAKSAVGQRVFVPGARCFGEVRGLFGGAAARVVVADDRVVAVNENLGQNAVLLALAATAHHAMATPGAIRPDLIVGHGVLGRLLARLAIASGGESPVVWERNVERAHGGLGYSVVDPKDDARRDYRAIYDVSGDAGLLDTLISHLAPGGEIVLAGFYSERLSFSFAPAFMREARIRAAAEWRMPDLVAVKGLIESGALSLDNLITHQRNASEAPGAYRTAFEDASCLKMVLDWRAFS